MAYKQTIYNVDCVASNSDVMLLFCLFQNREQDRLTLTPPTKLVQLLDLQDMGE